MDSGDDRYERRLVEETAKLRVEAAGMEVRLIERIGQAEGTLRQEIAGLRQEVGGLRQEVGGLEVRLVDRIAQSEGSLRQDMGNLEVRMERASGSLRSDILKWSFAFWIGQVVAMTAIMSALLR